MAGTSTRKRITYDDCFLATIMYAPLALLVLLVLGVGLFYWAMRTGPKPGEHQPISRNSREFEGIPLPIKSFPVIAVVGEPQYAVQKTCAGGQGIEPSYSVQYYSSADINKLRKMLKPVEEKIRKELPDSRYEFGLMITPARLDDTVHRGQTAVTAQYDTGPTD